jgi:uncharacterized membrane protein YhaH (DUF805 family)
MRRIFEFIFPYRLHRLAFFLRGSLLSLLTYILYSFNGSMDLKYFGGSVMAILLYDIFFIILPRCRDVEISGWWALLTLIPVANLPLGLILLFRAPVFLHRREQAML